MALVNSPKMQYYTPEAGEPISTRALLLRGALYALLAFTALVALLIWFGGDTVSEAIGLTGVVQGVVVNQVGEPVAESEVVLMTAPEIAVRTDATGFFTLRRVPVGIQSIMVSYGKRGQEYPVTIQRRKITDAGTLMFLTPPRDN